MESQLRTCRVCTAHEGGGELVPIFEKNHKIATNIFLICGVKILEFNSYCLPALICLNCLKDLSRSIKFRSRCRKTEKNLKKSTLFDIESLVWNGSKESMTDRSQLADCTRIKQESQVIKEEPLDEASQDLFENIESILVENGSEESNKLILSVSRRNDSSSDSDSEYENTEQSRHSKKKSPENDTSPYDSLAQCNLCFKSFTSLHSLRDHMRAIHQKLDATDMFKCPHCDRLFKMKYYLNRHIKSYHLKQIVKKDKRSKPRTSQTRIDGDEIFKEKLVGLNCPYCNKFLTSKHSLNDHIRVRHEFINFSERFLCDICGKDFPLKYYLLRHIRASHLKTLSYKKKNEDHLPCSICGKILKSKGNLSTHEKTHRILSPSEYWYCDICGNKFKGRGEMTVHIKKRHLYKIRYPCEICPGKSWRTLFQLQRHVKVIHHNIREFKCEWCGKEFGEKNKLVCHVRIHTGEQPFKCNFIGCSRAFTHQTDLRRHVWGHTGERPYKCQNQSCLKGFMKKSELTAHESRCHPAPRLNLQNVLPFQYQMM